ncbi:MAG: trypsin-like peptidase domain-containing protein [Planctomycetota bacterium]
MRRIHIATTIIVCVGSHWTHAAPRDIDRAKADAVRRAVEIVAPSMVTIETIGGAQPVVTQGPMGVVEESFRLAEGPTTGVVLSTDGLIITSSFNFARAPSVITVSLPDGTRVAAKLLGRDLIRRLALLKVNAPGLKPAQWVQHECGTGHPTGQPAFTVGQYAVACGRGLGAPEPQISLGIISALARRNGHAVQTDAKLSPVNYGGPLIDLDGRVLGLIVPMAGAGGALAGAEWYDSGIGFAVYRDSIDHVLDRLLAGQTIEPGKIGVILGDDTTDEIPLLDTILKGGVMIQFVAKQSPAAQAGLQPGDRLLTIDGQPIGDLLDLQRRLSDRAAGEEVKLTFKRRWKIEEVRLRLARLEDISGWPTPDGRRPRPANPPKPGEEPPSTQPAD